MVEVDLVVVAVGFVVVAVDLVVVAVDFVVVGVDLVVVAVDFVVVGVDFVVVAVDFVVVGVDLAVVAVDFVVVAVGLAVVAVVAVTGLIVVVGLFADELQAPNPRMATTVRPAAVMLFFMKFSLSRKEVAGPPTLVQPAVLECARDQRPRSLPHPCGRDTGTLLSFTFERPQTIQKFPQTSRSVVTSVAMIEDEVELRHAVRDALLRFGFDVLEGSTIAEARVLAPIADLLLLDLGLPDGDGLSLCSELAGIVPVIVISARGDEADRVAALELGADDYLAKPFSPRELIARCHSVLRRGQRSAGRKIVCVDLAIDADAYRVTRGGRLIPLTTKETELMICLAEHVGAPVRRGDLAERVWGTSLGFVSRSLDVHMSSLRRKLGQRPDGEGYIDTVHGVGYRLQL